MNVLLAITPVFLIILFGYLCRSSILPEQTFWRGAEKITYFLLFPALLVSKMINANLSGIHFFDLTCIILLLFFIATLLLLLLKPIFKLKDSAFSSIYQGGIRFNTYVGLAIIDSLYGSDALVIAIIIAAIMIPVVNVLSVCLLEFYSNSKTSFLKLLISIISNPLIIACLIGIGINVSDIYTPLFIQETLNIFSSAALPLGLLTVGAALKLNNIKSSSKALIISSTVKFLVLPSIAYFLCTLFVISPAVQNNLIILTALPTATASYILARQLGGNYELMATIITGQTLLAAAIMPLTLQYLLH